MVFEPGRVVLEGEVGDPVLFGQPIGRIAGSAS
jgi:hypothetical protein